MVEAMPKYVYYCETCEEKFSAFHLMSEKLEKRDECDKECILKKVFSSPINLNKNRKQQKTGEVVKQHIKDARQELEKEKETLKKKEYTP